MWQFVLAFRVKATVADWPKCKDKIGPDWLTNKEPKLLMPQ